MYRLLLIGLIVWAQSDTASAEDSLAVLVEQQAATIIKLEKRVGAAGEGLTNLIKAVQLLKKAAEILNERLMQLEGTPNGEGSNEGDSRYVLRKIEWVCLWANSIPMNILLSDEGYLISYIIHDRNTIRVNVAYMRSKLPSREEIEAVCDSASSVVIRYAKAQGWNWIKVIQTTEARD